MLFDGTYARGAAAQAVTDAGWLRALLDVEAGLARAGAVTAIVPADAAERIAAACVPERFELAALARDAGEHATVVVPLVRALKEAVGAADAGFVHAGATSQDVLDSAAMLLARRALEPLLADARAAAAAAARLAAAHRDTPMTGRTLLQQALPTTFGLRAAGWTSALDAARGDVAAVVTERLAVQLGGPVGTGSPALTAALARELGLVEPLLPWHTDRGRVVVLAAALGALSGSCAKVARDVTLLSQQEVGELREGGGAQRGGSSAMAHKRNPVAAVSVLACAARVPGLVATLLAGMAQEHERAAGAWQAEWGTLSELLALTGSAVAWARDLLEGLEVDPARMRDNLARLAAAGVAEAADPAAHVGAAAELVERVLSARGASASAAASAAREVAR
ncbi:lyase family protein [Conexibacter stalactiti]|uniref:Lyase family protein n=1 Tax=Conexibacter stalactiti TaxID=1940611 RepID=A0ABU4I0G8_9ACTN|nr:lyase family protein [Conexibacter stalactiti]MDW5598649.1 lyase family protein [Conexibacter stalactiti]MEC5039291.1 lyase family protein [Conexibacter stalactiti]